MSKIKIYDAEEFREEIANRKKYLLRDNRRNLSVGNRWKYSNNCNELKGIDFVIERIKKYSD